MEWGLEFVSKLEGMWSFALYDFKKGVLHLSRDRFGEKPLYYLDDKNQFIFGSEINYIREILGKKLEVNYEKLNRFDLVAILTDHDKLSYKKILKNSKAIFGISSVDGGLIGGASLKADDFKRIYDTL